MEVESVEEFCYQVTKLKENLKKMTKGYHIKVKITKQLYQVEGIWKD